MGEITEPEEEDMASKLDAFKAEILDGSKKDKDIAREAGVTMGAVRAYRNRHKGKATSSTNASKASKPKVATKPKAAPKAKRPKIVLPEGVDKQCPKCGCQASGDEEVQTMFGFRNVSAGKDGGKKKIPQSQCRTCRKASVAASKAKKDVAAKQAAAK